MQVLDNDPANWNALYRRGQAHAAMGDMARAVSVLEAALEAAPPEQSQAVAEKLEAARRTRSQTAGDAPQVMFPLRAVGF
jgi:tetratricopeptide (TPR) repeat protein